MGQIVDAEDGTVAEEILGAGLHVGSTTIHIPKYKPFLRFGKISQSPTSTSCVVHPLRNLVELRPFGHYKEACPFALQLP